MTEYASHAIEGLGKRVHHNRVSAVLVGVGAGLVIGGLVVAYYYNAQRTGGTEATNKDARHGDGA